MGKIFGENVVLSDPLRWLGRSVRFVVSGDLYQSTALLVTVIHTVTLVVAPSISHSVQPQGSDKTNYTEAFS